MLEAAGYPDLGMDAAGIVASLVVMAVVAIGFAIKDRSKR